MPRNRISYQGRIVSIKDGKKQPLDMNAKPGKASFLNLVLAEQHQTKNKQCKGPLSKFAREDKGTDDWVNTTTSWHRLTIFGAKAEEYAQNPEFNHGALVDVEDATYTEDVAYWSTKDNVQRAGRPETMSTNETNPDADTGSVTIKFAPRYDDNETPMPPAWDGLEEIGYNGGGGNGGADNRDYEKEGF